MKNSGTISSVSGNTLYLDHDDGSASTRSVAADATVTLNGDPSSLSALKAGDKVSLSGDPVTGISATR